MAKPKKYDAICIGMPCIDVIVGGADIAEFKRTNSEVTGVD